MRAAWAPVVSTGALFFHAGITTPHPAPGSSSSACTLKTMADWRAEMRRRQFIAGLGAEAWAVVDLARTFGIDHATLYRMQALASALKVGSEGGTDD
jgi:transcriptional regulator of acetoin/glycerol metabolism